MSSIDICPIGALVSGRVGIVIEQCEVSLIQALVRVVFNANKNHHINPADVDLSKPLGKGRTDKNVSHESPAKWDIDPHKFM